LNRNTCIWQIHYPSWRPRPRLIQCLDITMKAWKPTVGKSSKRRCEEMTGIKHERLKSLAFNEPTSQNSSVRKTSLAGNPKTLPRLLKKAEYESLAPGRRDERARRDTQELLNSELPPFFISNSTFLICRLRTSAIPYESRRSRLSRFYAHRYRMRLPWSRDNSISLADSSAGK